MKFSSGKIVFSNKFINVELLFASLLQPFIFIAAKDYTTWLVCLGAFLNFAKFLERLLMILAIPLGEEFFIILHTLTFLARL